MKKYLLTSWLKIAGIVAASGIGYQNNEIQLVSDNGNALYQYFVANDSLAKYSLDGEPVNDNMPKSTKHDLESFARVDNTWYAFGSGSKENRNVGFMFNKFSKVCTMIDLTGLYDEMKSFSELTTDDFNIEAVTTYNEDWLFINRGNGPKNANYIYVVQGKNLTDDFNIYYFEFDLPKINNVQSGFSDATVINNTLYFIATAEDETSTYNDGAIKGSLFGAIDLKKMKLLFTEKISDTNKFEGITVLEQNKKNVTFALCEDADDAKNNEAIIYKLQVDLKGKIK